MMYYTIKSEGYPVEEKKESILAKMEDIFFQKYVETEDVKYLRYFNHVAEIRNRLEFGV